MKTNKYLVAGFVLLLAVVGVTEGKSWYENRQDKEQLIGLCSKGVTKALSSWGLNSIERGEVITMSPEPGVRFQLHVQYNAMTPTGDRDDLWIFCVLGKNGRWISATNINDAVKYVNKSI